jgi:glycosyltransferase involved in cell wall biosynthesis
MQQSKPFYSIIVAVLNAAEKLPRCLSSIAAQTCSDRELIVIDGGSTDGSLDILRSRSEEIAYWEAGPDKGVYDAWNKALPHVNGDWVCFLGADDEFSDDKFLERLVPTLTSALPNFRIVYGRLNIISNSGQIVETVVRPWPSIKQAFLSGATVLPHPGTMHHASLFKAHGNFDARYRIAGDYDFMLRELQNADALYLETETFANMGIGGMSSSPRNMNLSLREIALARANNGLTAFSPRLAFRRILALGGLGILWIFGQRAFVFAFHAYRRIAKGSKP